MEELKSEFGLHVSLLIQMISIPGSHDHLPRWTTPTFHSNVREHKAARDKELVPVSVKEQQL